PAAQPGVPFITAGQTLPHMPQLLTSFEVLASQPSAGLPLHSWNGAMHGTVPHTPFTQVGLVFIPPGQTLPQVPQLSTSLVRLTSQPSFAFMLQSANVMMQLPTPHMPAVQPRTP